MSNSRPIGSRSCWGFWFLLACGLHSLIDIFTHAKDGPLLLFPHWVLCCCFTWSPHDSTAASQPCEDQR